jgi:hypothetical protein
MPDTMGSSIARCRALLARPAPVASMESTMPTSTIALSASKWR